MSTGINKSGQQPRITLVGAGPGDAELITLKGVKALQTANVVLYDALVNEELLNYAPAAAQRIYVGKRSGGHSCAQDAVNKLMADYALNYGHVVRLKGGDPFVFGRGYEELAYAALHNIPAVVVPGVSSAVAVPGLQNIPVTHRGLSESFWVVTGTTARGQVSAAIYDAAKTNATVVVLMGIQKLAEIVEIFKAEGKHNLPVALIQSGSTADEKVALGVIGTIIEIAAGAAIKAPAVIVIGDVVSLHPHFKVTAAYHDAAAQP